MEGSKCRELVASTGKILLEKGLVARTWGNISCRVSGGDFAISPSGMSYQRITADLVPIFHTDTKEYDGEPLTKDSYTNTALATGDVIESVTVTGSQTTVGNSDNVPSAAV
ncbi:MAG: class II aldolase/adducin family protein, partial [Lachnospiraceae bacterium]|nr:class II aldolase/adducin family protein [Lachnospiraceae bacterium]